MGFFSIKYYKITPIPPLDFPIIPLQMAGCVGLRQGGCFSLTLIHLLIYAASRWSALDAKKRLLN